MATKKVPQRRNKQAGKSTGTSKSSKYRQSNTPGSKAAMEKKKAYDTNFHKSKTRKLYRAALNKLKSAGKGKDNSHKKSGGTVKESRSKNRARNGKGGKSSKK